MQLYNTLSRTIEEFEAIDPENIRMYTCGPTVYREIHIGNFRTYITSDILRRVLTARGFRVTSVMNITDVGHMRYTSHGKQIDPIMEEAKSRGLSPLELSKHYTDVFLSDMKKLHILPPDITPRATEHIPEMIAIIKILLNKGYAYETDGNVYFNVKKFADYGKLSGNTLDKMDQLLEAVRVSVETDKKDSADFALWKRAAGDSVMQWDSPWGRGVPGWHIECSAMSIKYLGDTFDIHAGGEDLIFPHHEDEIAQSEAASGVSFVKYWTHTNWLLVENEKMSRSRGNVYTLSDLEARGFRPLSFRFLTFQTHYRSRMNFTFEALRAAQTALDKLYEIASAFPDPAIGCAEFENKFTDAIEHDLDMPRAIAIVWELLRSKYPPAAIAESLYKMDEVLGFNIREKARRLTAIPEKVMKLVAKRESLRRDGKFHMADQVRSQIEKMGYTVKDEKKETIVRRKI